MWQAPIVLRKFKVLGVEVTDLTMDEAVALLERLIVEEGEQTHSVYYVNTHTLNTAVEDPSYLGVLQRGDVVFGDEFCVTADEGLLLALERLFGRPVARLV